MKQYYLFVLLVPLLSGCGVNEVNSRGYIISKSQEEIPLEADQPILNEEASN